MNETNKNSPTLESIRSKREDIIALAERYGAYNLRVFGSVARAEATSDSDIDIVADFHPHTLIQRITLMQELSDLLGYPVDLVPAKNLRSHVRVSALRDAVSI